MMIRLPEKNKKKRYFISHLLIAGCDIVQLTCHSAIHQGLSMIDFSVPMIARRMEPCIVIFLDILYKHTP